jgi:hypothetical protein
MKVKKIEVEGANGKAALKRDGGDVEIDGVQVIGALVRQGARMVPACETTDGPVLLQYEAFHMTLYARADEPERWDLARRLHRLVEGGDGTNGDVHGYTRLIEMLAD